MGTDSDRNMVADFIAIDGVGNKTAKALIRAGVTSMSQLAKANVYELADQLEAVGAPVPVGRIVSQRWLFQAWDIVSASEPHVLDEDVSPIADSVDEAAVDEPEWEEQASFIVTFDRRTGEDGPIWQTRIWDNKLLDERVIQGADPDDWAAIVVDRIESSDD